MAFRLTLLCCAGTKSARDGGFADPDEPLDEGGARQAAAFRVPGPEWSGFVHSPALAARQTGERMGLAGIVEPGLADIDFGAWRGRSFADVHSADPDAFAAWLASPEDGAPGGETMRAVRTRIADWLGGLPADRRDLIAITHPIIVRAVLSETLGMPPAVTLRIDIAPLASATLSWNGSWRLQELRRN